MSLPVATEKALFVRGLKLLDSFVILPPSAENYRVTTLREPMATLQSLSLYSVGRHAFVLRCKDVHYCEQIHKDGV